MTENITWDDRTKSKCLLILNLQRPFVTNALDSLLSRFGKVEKFWLDNIKTHCYVEYSTIEEAINAREELYGMKWPADGKKLIVQYALESDISIAIERNFSPYAEKEKFSNEIIPEEPIKTLDNLFKKTQTKPHIYYLPLSEEEVQEKKNKLNLKKN